MTELIVGVVFGVVLGALMFRIMIYFAVRRAQGELENLITVMNRLQENMIMCRVEQHEGVFYVYNTRDQSFVAQGKTLSELQQAVESRWRDVDIYLTEGDQAVLQSLKATESK